MFGGQARRLGFPKESLRDESGRTLLERQRQRLAPWFHETLLLSGPAGNAASAEQLAGEAFPFRTVSDPLPYSGCGPMAGLLAALRECRTPWLALMPIDCPFFPPEVFGAALVHGASCLAVGFTDHRQRPQWLPGLYHQRCSTSLEAALARDELGLGRWMQSVPHHFFEWPVLEVDAERAFTNLNSLEQARTAGFLPPAVAPPAPRAAP